eukprot:TRINITY_DN5095_c0_g1_i1.p1 TRINITY_DN5095_c0_g1~~TRINITY_DN5095_c0_g1_i1.p1  ORF type:complete len:261 (-),score=73.13 TRINITY_DN5095_c0_g1_i1:157-939(-)
MHLKLAVLGCLLLGFEYIATFILFVNIIISIYGKKIFAAFLASFSVKYNDVSDAMKRELFEELNNMCSEDEKINILEIGGGSGTNFRFWSRPAFVEVVEPNPHFVEYFDTNRAKYPGLDIKDMTQGVGEDLLSAGIADCSVDAVVMTLVLCTVQDQVKTLQEVSRVLKPGGKMFYMEHVIAEEGSYLRTLQRMLMMGDFWPFMVDGCHADRPTDLVIEKFGFSSVSQKKYDLPLETRDGSLGFKLLGSVIKPHVLGVATK